MIIKEGVILQGLQLEMRAVLKHANEIWKKHGQELAITSGLDGTHSAGSYHYFGYALDLRTRYFIISERQEVVHALQHALARIKGGKGYSVILESTHIHVQYNA